MITSRSKVHCHASSETLATDRITADGQTNLDVRYRSEHMNQNYTLLHARADRLGACNTATTKQHGAHP